MNILLCAAALTMSAAAVQNSAPRADQPGPAQDAAAAPGAPAPAVQRPARDSRGIPVVSEAATPPAGTNQPFHVPQGAQVVLNPNQQAFAPQPAQGEMPPCSRTVTDRCTQTHERGVRNPR